MTDPWWNCSRCGEKNPPLIDYCSNPRCRKPSPSKKKPVHKASGKTRASWMIKMGVWMTVLTPLVFGASFFLPEPWSGIIKALFAIIKQLINL